MTKDKGILIKNVYYMLAYAFRILKQTNYEEIASEEFKRIEDLFAAILAKGISQQLKQGLYKEYKTRKEALPVMKGKMDIQGTIRNKVQYNHRIGCEFDELTINNVFNQILKTAAVILQQQPTVAVKQKTALKKVLVFLADVDTIDPGSIVWSRLRFLKNNQNYKMLMNICFFVLDGLLLTTEEGCYKMAQFSDTHMAALFERFVREYFREEHSYLSEIKAAQIRWNIDDGADENVMQYLPLMRTDITLRDDDKILIIDTKYYGRMMQSYYDRQKLHSNNLYQIYAYVKNMDTENSGMVSGMLLYAKTGETIVPDFKFTVGGNLITVKALDLEQDFKGISRDLDEIVTSYFETSGRH